MQLPFLKKSPPTVARQYLFALEISPGIVKSAIWSVVNDRTQVLAIGCAVDWDDHSAQSLINACDQTLSDATTHLDPTGKTQPAQVVLGLPPTWVEADKILPDKLQLVKDVTARLELKPVGFVVTAEAVVKFLEHSENVPPTAILLGFWPRELGVTLVRMGKIDGVHLIKRSPRLADDVVEGLSRFMHIDTLPSRMLLYDSGLDLEEIKQLLLDYPWQAPQKRLPFLHFPKIEILPADFTVRSIALAGGTEVARAIGLLPVGEETEVAPVSQQTVTSPEELGFVVDADVQNRLSAPELAQPVEGKESETEPPAEAPAAVSQVPSPPSRWRWPRLRLPRLRLPSWRWPGLPIGVGAWLGGVALLAVVGAGSAWWFLPEATVLLYVSPKNFTAQFDLVADTKIASVSLSPPLAVPAQEAEETVTADKTAPATGSKLVGDKATGGVTISNALDTSRKLAAGTVITSPSGLKFVLDEEVTVASASGSAGNLIPGKATVKATAAQIGSDSNLAAGTVFRVANLALTQVDAKNETAFSGGTSRQVKAVSKEDISQLRSALIETAKQQARQQLEQQVAEGQTLIAESVTVTTVAEEFDRKADEVADEVALKLTVKARGLIVVKADLQTVVDQQIKPQIPAGYTSISEQSQNFSVKKVDPAAVTFLVSATAVLLPDVDVRAVASQITGKFPSQARDYLESLPDVAQIDILITPPLPAAIATLPHQPARITVSIKALE